MLLVWAAIKYLFHMATQDTVIADYIKAAYGEAFYNNVVALVTSAMELEDKSAADKRKWVEAQLGAYVDKYGEYVVRACIEFVLSMLKK